MKNYILFLISFLFLSCNISDNEINTEQPNIKTKEKYLPSKLENTEYTIHLFYDNENKLTEYLEESSKNLYFKKIQISYKENLVDKVELIYESFDLYNYTNIYTFEYIDNKVVITNQFSDINQFSVTQTRTIRINNLRLLTNGYGIKTIYDNHQNLLEISYDNIDIKNKFDEKNSIFKNINTPQWLLYYVLNLGTHTFNNPLQIQNIITDTKETNSTIISYLYNSQNYPIKRIVTDNDYYVTETQIEYILK